MKTKIWIYFLAIIGVLLIFADGCKKKDNNTDSPTTIAIGSSYAGGIIFSIDTTGKHGLVCAPKDQGNGTDWTTAPQVCHDYTGGGYNDWYLPSMGELRVMYTALHKKGIGGFSNTTYWSSTQDTAIYACYIDFRNGYEGSGPMGAYI